MILKPCFANQPLQVFFAFTWLELASISSMAGFDLDLWTVVDELFVSTRTIRAKSFLHWAANVNRSKSSMAASLQSGPLKKWKRWSRIPVGIHLI